MNSFRHLVCFSLGCGLLAASLGAHESPIHAASGNHVGPHGQPDRIVLTWADDPVTTQAVTWRTDASVMEGWAEISTATPHANQLNPLRIAAQSRDAVGDVLATRIHQVHFQGLQPATRYAYRVGNGAIWSPWYHFTTASREIRPFSFLYFGDAQNEVASHWSRVCHEALRQAPRAAFTLHVGDLINRANSDPEWADWIAAPGWFNACIPVMAVPGNHEYYFPNGDSSRPWTRVPGADPARISPQWHDHFSYPVQNPPAGTAQTCYYFDYQGARFVMLDSNVALEEQAGWLRSVLADHGQRWLIVACHHPLFSPSSLRDTSRVRDQWKPVFDEFRVDLVLSGHDHTYARSGKGPRGNASLASPPVTMSPGHTSVFDPTIGTIYVISVSGPKSYPLGEADFAVKATDQRQMFQVISIDGDTLSFEARDATGDLFDAFILHKQTGAPNRLENLSVAKAN